MPRLAAALAVLALSLSACSSARIRVDPALDRTAPYAVSGANPRTWNAPLGFGPYRTGAVRDAGTFGWSAGVLGVGLSGAHRPYAWTAAGPEATFDAECHARGLEAGARGVTFDVQGATGAPALACAFRRDGAEGAWILALRATGRPAPAYRGALRGETGVTYAVRSVHALEGSPLPVGTPAGWEIARDGRVVALVETMNTGRVWLPAGTADADAIAAASFALLLFGAE